MDVRIETLTAIHVARIRHVGPYTEVGPCFERLFTWAARVGVPTGRILTLSYDDPDTVAPEQLCSNACVEVRTDAMPPPDIAMGSVGAGRYAIVRLQGPYAGIAEVYRRLFREWLPQSGETVDDRPCMELYHNTLLGTSPEHLVTDVCLPLRQR